jgi:hypothetical protein
LPIICFGQLDTVKVYEGFDISYMLRKDTVLMSQNKWNNIVNVMRNDRKLLFDCNALNDKYSISVDIINKQIEEYKNITDNLNERSLIYQGAYEMCTERIVELNNLWQQGIKYSDNERKRGIFTGATWGVAGGLLVGIITAAILLK